MTDKWSMGVLVGLPLFTLTILLCLGFAVFFLYFAVKDDDSDCGLFSLCAVGAALLIVAIAAISYFPYSKEYHQWQHHGGVVQTINSRLIAGDNATEQRFVVQFKDQPGQWSCDDTRCSALQSGDHLDLSCKRHYQWTGSPGYDCNFVRFEPKAQ